MTGVPTQFAIADLVLETMRNDGEAVPGDAELPFFYLGAIGPALGDFLPTHVEDGASGTNAPLFGVWFPILGLLAGTPGTPGLAANLLTLKDTLRRFGDAVRDEDKFALLDMKTDLEALPGVITAVRSQLATVNGLRTALPSAIAGVRPRAKVLPAGDRHPRDAVHGHSTGTFWGKLRRRAAESGDPRLEAFGLGASVGYAGAVCGNPFVNGVVGAPHRNHWWRHRWVSNYIDSWVWGYYRMRERVREAGREIVFTSSGRVPVPPYPAWDNIPGAELQDRFAIGGITPDAVLNAVRDGIPVPPHLPDELVTLWLDCYNEAVGDPPSPGVDAEGLQGAYAMTWLTTWIASSAELLGATAPDRINEPDDCGERPDWVTPDGGVVVGGTLVPPPTISQPSPSVAELASAIAVAILGVMNFVLGNAAAGIALIVAAVAIIDEATDPDWDELRCHAGWVDAFIVQLDNAFRELLTVAGLGPPYAVQLAHNEIQFTASGDIVPSTAALRTCRSPSADEGEDYPASVWSPQTAAESNWTRYPTEPVELPRQISYAEGSWWPRHFVDGFSFVDNGPTAVPRFPATQDNPLDAPGGMPSVLDHDEWELRMQRAELGGTPQGAFGNAVDVALALIRAPQDELLDWDLDGDRGLGWPTWVWSDPAGQPGDVVRQ
ncbi:MAG: hypothetical protein H0T55_05355 [Rubrobacteraceae bacterium]|nr:hypothetical protein [Rubrobacteraceae bacterium]MDQ3251180.1 hypothetical protein [Actinomycetota bacterium]MDQ3435786.1 hypothetical protein [Actinomycetota bacterium]